MTKIVTLWCTCTVGTTEFYNHVITLMYKVKLCIQESIHLSRMHKWSKGME